MAGDYEPMVAPAATTKRLSWRTAWVPAWSLVLLAEVLFLTLCFDAAAFARQSTWWGALLHESPHFLRIGVSIAAVLLLMAGRGWQAVARPTPAILFPRRLWPWMVAHLTVFGGFLALSAFLFEGGGLDASLALPLSLAWWLLGTLTLGTWALALWPAGFWLALLQRGRGTLLTAAVVGTLAYIIGNMTMQLWRPLSAWTFSAVHGTLHCFLRDFTIEPQHFVIRTPAYAVQISRQCSGYEGIGLVTIFLLTYLWLFRRHLRFPRALVLVPLAVIVVWVLNVWRIAALVILGDAGFSELATQGFHSEAGWLAFNAVALGFAALAEHSPRLRAPEANDPRTASQRNGSATTVHLSPFLAMLAAGMAARACGATPEWSAVARLTAPLAVLWCFRRSYRNLRLSSSWVMAAVGVATALAWIVLVPWCVRGGEPAQPGRGSWAGLAFLCRLLDYLAVAPLVEELAFRRYLTRRIVNVDFESVDARRLPLVAVILSSVLFGVLHGAYWVPATVAGCAYALAYRSRGRLGDAVLAHATTNTVIAAYVMRTGQWSLWS